MSLLALTGNKKRRTFSKYGKALDNFFMIFQPENSNLLRVEPSPEILEELEQRAFQSNLKLQKAKELQGSYTFRGISREKGASYLTKHEGANRSYNPKYEFIKNKAVTYTIPKSSKDPKNTDFKDNQNQKSSKIRPLTAKGRYYQLNDQKIEENNEITEEPLEEINPNVNSVIRNSIKEEDEIIKKQRVISAKTDGSNSNPRFKKQIFGCIDFNKQTKRRPFHFVSSCVNEHNFKNFKLNEHTGKNLLNFKQYLNRKTYLCEDAKFELPDKFYLNNFNWNNVYPEKSKCFINFDRFREKNNINLQPKQFINSSVDVKDIPEMCEHLSHFKRIPSPNFDKILGRNQAKLLKERVVSSSGFRPKSAYNKYSNGIDKF